MKMTSMKRSADEKEEAQEAIAAPGSQEDYPYGLCLRLGAEELEKLGISNLPAVGDKFMIMAMADVKAVSESEYAGGDKQRNLELQITDMTMGRHGQEKAAAEVMYPAKKA